MRSEKVDHGPEMRHLHCFLLFPLFHSCKWHMASTDMEKNIRQCFRYYKHKLIFSCLSLPCQTTLSPAVLIYITPDIIQTHVLPSLPVLCSYIPILKIHKCKYVHWDAYMLPRVFKDAIVDGQLINTVSEVYWSVRLAKYRVIVFFLEIIVFEGLLGVLRLHSLTYTKLLMSFSMN